MASFANIVTHKFGEFQTGAKLAELAIMIVDRQKNKFNETQALNTANQNILGWVRPIRSRIPFHVRAYESGMMSGNIEGACVGKWFSYFALYHSASPLGLLEEDMRTMLPKAKELGFVMFGTMYSMLLQLVQNLIGMSESTIILKGETMDESEERFQKMPFRLLLGTFQSYGLVVFGDFEKGAENALERGHSYNQKMMGMQYGMEPFYRGISLYVMARRTRLQKYKTPATQVRKQYQIWVKKGCVNLIGLLQLLDAEHLALYGKKKDACKKYEDSISTLTQGGFYNNAGVACERYGAHLAELQQGDGRSQFEQALEHYTRWGAKKKVELLQKYLDTL
jgi:hypothetical protein